MMPAHTFTQSIITEFALRSWKVTDLPEFPVVQFDWVSHTPLSAESEKVQGCSECINKTLVTF